MFHNAIENPQLLTLVNPGRPPARRRKKKNPKAKGGSTVAKRKVYIDPDTGLFISEAEAKRRGIKAHRSSSKKAKSRKAKSRKAKSRKAKSRKTTRARSRKKTTRAKSRKSTRAKSRKKTTTRKKTTARKKTTSKALKKARTATKKAKTEAKRAKKAATKAKRQAKKAKSDAQKARKAATKARKAASKAKSRKTKSRKAKSRKGTGRGKYARGGVPASARKAARKARSGKKPHGGSPPPGRGARGGYIQSYAGARKKHVRGQKKAGWHWTPGYYTAVANPGELKRVQTGRGYRYQYRGKFISKDEYDRLRGKQRKAKSRKNPKGKSRRGKSRKARSRRNPMRRRDARGRFVPKRGRKNPGRAPKRGGWKGTMPRRDSRGRFMRKNAGVMGMAEGAYTGVKETAKSLWKPVVGASAGFFGARTLANMASVSTMVPESVQPYAPMLAQLLAGGAVWFAGSKVEALEEYKTPALVGVGLSIVEALVNRFAPETVQAYAGVPDPGLGADLDVYEAALRGYGGLGQEGLDEGWSDYVPGDEELLAALEAQDMLGEYIAEPLGEYIAEPLGEYVAEPLGEYVAEPLGEYVAESLSGVDIYEAMAGGGSDSPAIGEYVAEPLSGTEVYEAMAGNATDAEIDFYLQEAGLGAGGPAPAAEGIGAYGPAPAAEGIGMIDDAAELEEELDELQDELEELEELDELDISELGGLGLEIEALDGMGTEVDIFDQGMSGAMTDRVVAMRQRVSQQRSARRAALARRLNQLKAQQRRTYATHIHSPITGGGIFGDENVVGKRHVPLPPPLAVNAQNLRAAIRATMMAKPVQALTGPAKAAKVYQLVQQRLGVPGSTAFRLAFREAYKQCLQTHAPVSAAAARAVMGRSPRRVPAYGGPAVPGSIRPAAGPRVMRPSTEFQDPVDGAPMMVKPIPQAPPPEPMEEITDQWAGMVGGVFRGTIFS